MFNEKNRSEPKRMHFIGIVLTDSGVIFQRNWIYREIIRIKRIVPHLLVYITVRAASIKSKISG